MTRFSFEHMDVAPMRSDIVVLFDEAPPEEALRFLGDPVEPGYDTHVYHIHVGHRRALFAMKAALLKMGLEFDPNLGGGRVPGALR